jgi:hypothetical protein
MTQNHAEGFEPFCPECDEPVRPSVPVDWIGPNPAPHRSHASDETALCPVMSRGEYVPADLLQYLTGPFVTLVIIRAVTR